MTIKRWRVPPPTSVPQLDAELFAPKLKEMSEAIANRLEREWPEARARHPWSHHLLRSLVAASTNAYRTAKFVCADTPPDPARDPRYSHALPPLIRGMLEQLATAVFLFDDLPARTDWYYRSGLRDMEQNHARFVRRYAKEPTWSAWLATSADRVARWRAELSRLPQVLSTAASQKRWPRLNAMKKELHSDERRAFLNYLDEWHYGDLSQFDHARWAGLNRATAFLLVTERDDPENHARHVAKRRSDIYLDATLFLLALLSEVEAELRYGHSSGLRYVWGVLMIDFGVAAEIYKQRYEGWL